MLQLIASYLIGLGPYLLAAAGLGVAIPLLFAVGRPSRWLLALAILVLCLIPIGSGDVSGGSEGSLFRQIGWGSVFLLAAFYALLADGRVSVPWKLVPIPYLLLLAYALMSVTWSADPLVSARRAVQLIGVLLVALALVRKAKSTDSFDAFVWPGAFCLLIGVIALAIPGLSIDPDGNYKGFTYTKNNWGQFALFMSLVLMSQMYLKGMRTHVWWIFALATVSLLATKSATSIVIYAASVVLFVYWSGLRKHAVTLVPATISISLLCLTLLFVYFLIEGDVPVESTLQAALGSLGKTTTLTGRTELWQWMGYEIARHPWFGAGYGGFWMGLDGPSSSIVLAFNWRPGQAHNGYLDLINELGYVGFAIFILVLCGHLRNIVLLNKSGKFGLAIFHFSILVGTLLLNTSETSFLRTTHLWWIVLSISIVGVHVVARTTVDAAARRDPPRLSPLLGNVT